MYSCVVEGKEGRRDDGDEEGEEANKGSSLEQKMHHWLLGCWNRWTGGEGLDWMAFRRTDLDEKERVHILSARVLAHRLLVSTTSNQINTLSWIGSRDHHHHREREREGRDHQL